jgi:hypothetical protein
LLDPIERQVFEQFFQREFRRLASSQNQLDDVGLLNVTRS